MDAQNTCRLGARHLSQIQEESDSREQSTCFLPPIVQQQTGETGGGETGEEADRQEVRRLSAAASLAVDDLEEDSALLEELCRIEAGLREAVLPDVERQRETGFLRRQDNNQLRTHLCYLSLGQRVAKPWVSSYFRKFPMHIYCLPVQPANHRSRRRGLTNRR